MINKISLIIIFVIGAFIIIACSASDAKMPDPAFSKGKSDVSPAMPKADAPSRGIKSSEYRSVKNNEYDTESGYYDFKAEPNAIPDPLRKEPPKPAEKSLAYDKAPAKEVAAKDAKKMEYSSFADDKESGKDGSSLESKPPSSSSSSTASGPKSKGYNAVKIKNSQERVIIYSANLRLEVENVNTSAKKIISKAKSYDGYVQSIADNIIIVRVPAEKLETFLLEMEKFGKVISKNISSSDVTEEFLDLTIRLDNALKMRKRLLALLKKAANVADSLAIEQELQRITETIERYKGRLKYLSDLAAFSTVTINIIPRPSGPVISPNVLDRPRGPFSWVTQLGAEFLLDY